VHHFAWSEYIVFKATITPFFKMRATRQMSAAPFPSSPHVWQWTVQSAVKTATAFAKASPSAMFDRSAT
jgi:hypothetical protein